MSDDKLTDEVNKGFKDTCSWVHATVTTDTSITSDNQNCNDNKKRGSISLAPRTNTPISVTYMDLEEFGFPGSLAPSIRWGKGRWNENEVWRQCNLHSWIEVEA